MLFLTIFLRVAIFLSMLCFAILAGAHFGRHTPTAAVAFAMALFLAVAFGATFVKTSR
jgi:flagellar biosynthesis protein FliP